MRSANEPAMSAGVMIANVIWKHHVDGLGDRRRQRVRIVRTARHVDSGCPGETHGDNPPMNGAAAGERQAVGDDEVDHRDQARDGEARHHRVADVLLADHAAVEEAEARDRHHQNERHRGQHPRRVAGVAGALFEDCGVAASGFGAAARAGAGRVGRAAGSRGRCRSSGGAASRAARGSVVVLRYVAAGVAKANEQRPSPAPPRGQ